MDRNKKIDLIFTFLSMKKLGNWVKYAGIEQQNQIFARM